MKIGVDIRCLMQKNYSGVSWYTFCLLEALLAWDKKNQYLLFYNSSKKVVLPKLAGDHVRFVGYHYPNKLFNLFLNFFNWPKLDKLLGGVDVFLAPNLHFVAWSAKAKKIIVVHDLSFIRFPEFFSWKMSWWHKLILFKNILGQADIIVADSQSTKNDLRQLLGISEEKIKVVYPGVDESFKIYDQNNARLKAVREKYGLSEKFILTLGTLEPRKNLESVIEAFSQMPGDYELVIAGGRGWKAGRIYRLTKNNDRIKVIGYVDEADKPALYNLTTLLVYPSYYEGFGLPLLEAMASGCPVICGANSSLGEAAGEAAVLVDVYNINEIEKALEEILGDEQLRKDLASRGLAQAAKFSWQKTAEEFLKIINNL